MANIAKNASLVSLASTFTRSNGQPLDDTTIFTSLQDAKNYSQNDGRAYVGQIIIIIENSKVDVCVITSTSGDLVSLIPSNSTGTRTFETYPAMEQALTTLSRGQIVTLVNETTTEAYIVDWNKHFVKIEGNVQELSELDTETLLAIFDGTFVPDEVWPSNAIQQDAIDEILNDSFEESEIPSNGVKKDTIDSILEGNYQDPTYYHGDVEIQ